MKTSLLLIFLMMAGVTAAAASATESAQTTLIVRKPFGIKMCRLLCQKTLRCWAFYFNASGLVCRLGSNGTQTSNTYGVHKASTTERVSCCLTSVLIVRSQTDEATKDLAQIAAEGI